MSEVVFEHRQVDIICGLFFEYFARVVVVFGAINIYQGRGTAIIAGGGVATTTVGIDIDADAAKGFLTKAE